MIKTNKELSDAVNNAIAESGMKKLWIAEQLGISNQHLSQFLNKKGFSIDDANKILNLIGYEASATVKRSTKNNLEK